MAEPKSRKVSKILPQHCGQQYKGNHLCEATSFLNFRFIDFGVYVYKYICKHLIFNCREVVRGSAKCNIFLQCRDS